MLFIQGLIGFFRLTRLTFVKKQHLDGDLYTFYFTPSRRLHHRAGQHGVFLLPGFKGVHIFSLSSAPEEQYVAFTTHVRKESRYKQFLAAMKPGTKLSVCGPVLFFTFRPGVQNYLFLAQGIGITPFRSLLVHAHQEKLSAKTTLVHVAPEPHTFRDETERFATHAFYPTDPESFTAIISEQAKGHDGLIYLSGSPRFVKLTKRTLRGLGVARSRMKSDSFLGY